MIARLIPLVLSWLILAAHFLRRDQLIAVLFCLAIPALMFLRRRWALQIVQWSTALSALLWVQTTVLLVQQRMMLDAPWVRMVAILGAVIALTLWAAWLLRAPVVRDRYPGE